MMTQLASAWWRSLSVVGAAIVVWSGTVVLAQPPGGAPAPSGFNQGSRPPQPPNAPGGFGGPGGPFGMARGPEMGGNPLDLLRRKDVRKELELDDDQVQQLGELESTMRNRMREMFMPQRDGNAEAPRGQRREDGPPGPGQDFRAIFDQYNKDLRNRLSNILLPHQLKRFDQLTSQLRLRGGAMAVFSGEVSRELGMTDQQRDELRTKAEGIERSSQQKIAEIRRQATEDVVKLFTAEQQAKFREMVGPPFEFQNEPAPPGPPGQGGPPQPPARNN